ncbi:hypothetical protein WCE00_01725 [Acinetobacter haemolyticus]|uniref:hypothetical protein n=1 Tax=Acinetobacter haemolyticus TaxID=29430 RepID=UPI0034D61BCC
MSKIKVVAGDLEQGDWSFSAMFGNPIMINTMKWKGETINIKTGFDNVEQLDEEKVKKLAGTAGWGLAGAVLLGPLGAIGGMLLGGNKKEVTFACYLKDGRKFMATTDSKTWTQIVAAKF